MKRGLKRKLKRKGSSLVAVLVICSILLVTATVMIGVATSDVRMRINESKKLQNLYKADSGLDVVSNIIYKNVEVAIEYSRSQILQDDIEIFDESDSQVYDELNSEFKKTFLTTLVSEIIINNDDSGNNGNTLGRLSQIALDTPIEFDSNESITRQVENRLFYSIKNYRYIESISDSTYDTSYKKASDLSEIPTITIKNVKYDSRTKKITLTICSEFKTSGLETSVTKLENKKIIETEFTIIAPNYADVLNRYSEYSETRIQSPYSNVITADGNLKINENTQINGSVWVKGDAARAANDNPSNVYGKYDGGIVLAESKNLTAQGIICTAGTFSVVNSSKFELVDIDGSALGNLQNYNGNIYANNFYVGPIVTGENAISSNVIDIKKNMITYNDLAINSSASKIDIKNNYYGLSNTSSTDEDTKGKSSKRSGCIIVNKYGNNLEDSYLKIGNNAFINGVAYIDTGDDEGGEYETGESIAIKGNYKAYTEVLPSYKVTLKYYNPLQLIETIDGDSTVNSKAQYFKSYYNNSNSAKTGNITIENRIIAVGAYSTISGVGVTEDDDFSTNVTEFKDKQREYAKLVLGMNSKYEDNKAEDIFNNGKVDKSVKGDIANNIQATVDFSQLQIDKGSIAMKIQNSNNLVYVVNTSENDDVIIDNGVIKIGDGSGTNSSVIIDNNDVKAVIITKGNVKINEKTIFTGSIIAGGEVEINDELTIKYDPRVVANIIDKATLANYFITDGMEVLYAPVNTGDNISKDIEGRLESNGYNVSNIVNNGLWKILK